MTDTVPSCPRQDERKSLRDLRAWLEQRFARRLQHCMLFGSRARGEGHEFSDLDVLVVVDDLTSAEANETAARCGDLMTEHQVLVSPLALSSRRWSELIAGERRIAREILRDGVPV